MKLNRDTIAAISVLVIIFSGMAFDAILAINLYTVIAPLLLGLLTAWLLVLYSRHKKSCE